MAKRPNALTTGTSEPDQVDAFMRALDHPLRDVAERLRRIILGADPRVGEGIYWNAPTFYFTGAMAPFDPKTYARYLAGFNFFKQDAIRLIFLRGAHVKDPTGLLEGDFKDGRRIALFRSLQDVEQHERTLVRIIQELITQLH